MQVARDGTLLVDERIQYAFSGPFSGGFRDVALRKGESVSDVRVSEDGNAYRSGGCTELGCSDAAGTFGVKQMGDRARIVWHYRADDEAARYLHSMGDAHLSHSASNALGRSRSTTRCAACPSPTTTWST